MKRNIRDDFESIYLRFNTVKRDIAKADQSILNDTEFKRTVKFVAGKSYALNHGLYESNGFDFEDILSVATLFGLAFHGGWSHQHFETSRDKYNTMIHYINQRLNRLCEWIVKKFCVDDVIVHSIDGIKFRVDSGLDHGNMNADPFDCFTINENKHGIKVDGVEMWGIEDSETLSEKIESYEELVENTKKALHDGDNSVKARNQHKKLATELSNMRTQKRQENHDSKILTKDLKRKLSRDPQKYSDLLSYYATTKHVSKEIRRAARVYCKRYDIDYVSWVRKKLESDQYDRTEFTF